MTGSGLTIPACVKFLLSSRLFANLQSFHLEQHHEYLKKLKPRFEENEFIISKLEDLSEEEHKVTEQYFKKTIYPMITPMVYDSYHTFPILMNKLLIFGVTTKNPDDKKKLKKLSFIQIPQNLPRFYEIDREDMMVFVPIEEIIRRYIDKFFRNIEIVSVNLFRITRNGDFTLEESDEIDGKFSGRNKEKAKNPKNG